MVGIIERPQKYCVTSKDYSPAGKVKKKMFKSIPSRKGPVEGSAQERHLVRMSHVGRCGTRWRRGT